MNPAKCEAMVQRSAVPGHAGARGRPPAAGHNRAAMTVVTKIKYLGQCGVHGHGELLALLTPASRQPLPQGSARPLRPYGMFAATAASAGSYSCEIRSDAGHLLADKCKLQSYQLSDL